MADTADEAMEDGKGGWDSEEDSRGLGLVPFPSNLVIRTEGAWRARLAADRPSGFSDMKPLENEEGGSILLSEKSVGVARPEPVGVKDWER